MTAADRPRTDHVLEMRSVVKRFGPTTALGGVDLSVRPGEVHALIGENGAGKSTLMKVLAGVHRPDSGAITLAGKDYKPTSPLDGRDRGVAMIYQELNLAQHLSVEANILLGMEQHRFGFVRRRAHEKRVREALELLGRGDIAPGTIVGELSIGAQQLVEIARALVTKARIIVLDEPTSSLTIRDTERLMEVINRLRERGVSIVYISHFLEEVFQIGDRFTVLRNGETVATGELKDTTKDEIISWMVGRSLDELFPRVEHHPGEAILNLEELSGSPMPSGLNLELRRGEILGLAGLIGAGRTETLRAIYGLTPIRSGQVKIAGYSGAPRSPHEAVRRGLGLLSENRKDEGLAVSRSIADNTTLSAMNSVANRIGWIKPSVQKRHVQAWIDRIGIKCKEPTQAVENLSGGNQQKVAIARLLHQDAEVLLLDEPTRGVDVGSKVEIYRLMGELAAAGKAVLFVSSYIPELLGVSDRIAVMSRGRLESVRSASDCNELDILRDATRGEKAS